ncbi:MAG TPA: hypothetical protein PKE47_03585 [Verrucomicrobiota bacterium]|nr:hypothetical protein [Verrucomicrobiota bacterium]
MSKSSALTLDGQSLGLRRLLETIREVNREMKQLERERRRHQVAIDRSRQEAARLWAEIRSL